MPCCTSFMHCKESTSIYVSEPVFGMKGSNNNKLNHCHFLMASLWDWGTTTYFGDEAHDSS